MNQEALILFNLAEALGIGLLIGAEREQRMSQTDVKSSAGIRTFAITALLGAVAQLTGGVTLLVAAVLGVVLLAGLAYWRGRAENVGLTTEIFVSSCLTVGVEYDFTQISTRGSHRLINEGLRIDETWNRGVRVSSDQTAFTVFLRLRV